ncbi:hypothetical protein H5P29_25645 [Aminobacter sp. MDW-2]|nr:hypothetical protein [Aminobacter sp. MDW-2]QNH37326.1 hypothetical protein H5P29_25645 [Aminobacter sp. MDW-2]
MRKFSVGKSIPYDEKNFRVGTIADLCRGTVVGRSNDRDITLFKAVGSSLADLITARLIYHSLPYETPVVSPTHGLCADRPAIDEVT